VLAISGGPPGSATVPVIDAVLEGGRQAFTGASFTLGITAHDPNDPGAALSFEWDTSGLTVEQTGSTLSAHLQPCSGAASATVTVSSTSNAASVSYRFEIVSCAVSCNDLKTSTPALTDGVYTIDPDGPGPGSPVQASCDMTTDGGGWTFVAYYSASTTESSVFDVPVGTYLSSRAAGQTYSLGMLPSLPDTEMMIALDGADAVAAQRRQGLVFFRYPRKHPNFNRGPGSCTSDEAFDYRLQPGQPYTPGGGWACTSTLWSPVDASGRYLVQFGGPGVFQGGGLLSSGADQGWGHAAWIYVR